MNPTAGKKEGAADAGRYFRYMADFVGLTAEDAETIRRTRPVIEKHLPDIVARFYTHLLRYPPTRKFFLKPDGSIDHDYVELRMRHLTNFWLRTADAVFDDDYASYVDYVGRAHTSHGADPTIYIPQRYVVGQVGMIQHAISQALIRELLPVDPAFAFRAEEAWDKLMMVLLELMARAYGTEREAERFEPAVPLDAAVSQSVDDMARRAFALEHATGAPLPTREVWAAHAADIPDGGRRVVDLEGLSIGLFHHRGTWYAVRNSCLHRGGPIAAGPLDGDTLTCPWHGFAYNLTNGQLLVDPNAALDTYAVVVRDGEVYVLLPDLAAVATAPRPPQAPVASSAAGAVCDNEFRPSALPPGRVTLVRVDSRPVVVANVGGAFHAVEGECTHAGAPMEEGSLDGAALTCPWHGSVFDVTSGAVLHGPAAEPLAAYRVVVDGDLGRVEPLPPA